MRQQLETLPVGHYFKYDEMTYIKGSLIHIALGCKVYRITDRKGNKVNPAYRMWLGKGPVELLDNE